MQGWAAREAVFQPQEAVCVKARDVAGNLVWELGDVENGDRGREEGPGTEGAGEEPGAKHAGLGQLPEGSDEMWLKGLGRWSGH